MSRRKRRGHRKREEGLVAHYECQGCGRRWKEDLKSLVAMRQNGQLPGTYSGTSCPCGHPYIRWTNYDGLAPRLRKGTGRTGGEP